MSDKIKKHLSDCCNAPLKIISADEGTSHYECEKCGKSCNDIYYYDTEGDKIKQEVISSKEEFYKRFVVSESSAEFNDKGELEWCKDDLLIADYIDGKTLTAKHIWEFIEKKLTQFSQLSREEERDRIREIFKKDKIIYCTLHTSNNAYELCDVCSLGKKIKDRILQTLTAKQDE